MNEIRRGGGRFSAIIQQAVTPEPEPEVTLVEPEPKPEPAMPKAVQAPATKVKSASNVSKSKAANMKQAAFYVPNKLSLELDQWLMQYNLVASDNGQDTLDRSDVVARLLESLIELSKVKGVGRIALEQIEALKISERGKR